MASPRKKTLFATAAALVVGVTGYYLYSAFAVQGQGTLAQAPLNVQTTVPPAFIMGVDNSGSMSSDETLCRTAQGGCVWNSRRRSFFDADGVAIEPDNGNDDLTEYMKVVDAELPRPDHFGAARDPEFNRAYFNPQVTYLPWQKYDGTFEDNSPVDKAVEDVRTTGGTTYNFTAPRQATYTYQSGMVMAQGTIYLNNKRCNRAPGSNTTTNNWVTLTQDLTFTGECETDFLYYPAVVYLTTTAPPPPGFFVGPAPKADKRILIKGAGPKGTDLYKYEYLASNFETGGAAAVQNFANWWTYYGNRNRAMISAMTQSLVDITNMRVGYFQINPPPPSGNVKMYDMSKTDTDKKELYGLMRALNAKDTTPTRRAVAYMVEQFRRTDKDAPVQLVCQKNAGMLFTDGYTNDSQPPALNVGDVDGGMAAPFGGGVKSSNTIADYAMYGYQNNLRTDLKAGQVPYPKAACDVANPDPRLDCQKNLHMNFYGITLGARGAVYDVDAAATTDPYKNPPSWGATGTMNLNPRNVDDIWHAAINSRGEFINATSPTAVTAAMRRILQQVGAGATPSGSLGLTGARVGTGSLTVEPFYESTNSGTDWYSTLTGAEVSKDAKTGAIVYKNIWEASAKLPAPATRSTTTWFGTTTGSAVPTVKQFAVANLGAAPFQTLCSNTLFARCTEAKIKDKLKVSATDAVNYLLGDQTNQAKNGKTVKLRDRTTPLGDIVNSSPVVSTPNMDDYGYTSLRGTTTGSYDPYDYANFLKNTKKNRDSMVYVGANDGMLHAFDGKTGIERFAYIPATALGHMGNLLFPYSVEDKNDQTFSHRYFVDGPVTVSDARINSSWKTVLVGTAGAGGRGVFGLNVSNPTSFAATDVLWELNDKVSTAEVKDNIGYVLGKPVIVPVKVGTTVKWKAIFGNGYGSNSGKATLFVVDMETGAVQTRVATETGGPVTSNGLGNIIVIDRWLGSSTDAGRDGYADTVYAGDQNGAVWKFDLRTDKPSIAVGGKPLFVAKDGDGNRQPILGGFEAASGPSGGVMLYFGTGSFSFENDGSDTTMQSVYGVLDSFTTTPVSGRSALLEQRVMLDGAAVRTVTKNSGLGKMGWFMDLGVFGTGDKPVADGERFVGNPVIANGIVFFPTYDPSSTVDCGTSGNNWLYGLDALTGGAALNGVRVGAPDGSAYDSATGAVKLDTKGTAPIKDVAVLATPRQGILSKGDDPTEALKAQCSMVVQVAGASPLYLPRPCGRQSWRQVL